MGCPIRKSADQSFFAAPHGLSQRSTSFIASQRQGIHRIPLRHLIALIIDAHRSARTARAPARKLFYGNAPFEKLPSQHPSQRARSYKDQFASNTSEDGAVMLRPLTVALAFDVGTPKQSDVFPLYDVRQPTFADARILARFHAEAKLCFKDEPTTGGTNEGAPFAYGRKDPFWWSQTGSNRRPHACKARALPTELWPLPDGNARRPKPLKHCSAPAF